ncbi:mannitol dehydrogenase [Chromatiales bacterium (ex Bugula neritina AB1)]|nr:mannitol dehydrogenase [Chromatiales bacterium (ex Bugula neritina AB1)]
MINLNTNSPFRLSDAALPTLPEGVLIPGYDRSSLKPGIVHIGLGNFHRAHQSWYLHRLMQTGAATDWAIIGAGVRPEDSAMREKLLAQDCLTTLIELDPGGQSIEVTGSMIDFLPIEEDNASLIRTMSDPAIRIVSLTVTEGGYFIDPDTDGLDTAHREILYDAENPATPRTAFGAIVAALKIRRANGHKPFTGQSCDNLQGNGDILRQTVIGLARLSDPDLADWIASNVTFPNSMVDCIVPATKARELALVQNCGIDDAAPVTHENFRQWVMEDNFCAGRPDWDLAGATFRDSIHDYETMKLRILNAGHQVLANAGELLSVETIAGCMAHPLISKLFRKVESEEIAPLVSPVPEMAAEQYVELIATRFSNPEIVDTTRRVAFDGSSRHAGFVLPIVRDALAAGSSVEGLALVEALWARMCEGIREDGIMIEPNDPHWDSLVTAAFEAKAKPRTWLEQKHIYGDLCDEAAFAEPFERWLSLIRDKGTEAALAEYCGA